MKILHRSLLIMAITLTGFCWAYSVQAEGSRPTRFNESRLKALGIDPSTAAYFSEGARFTPGIMEVALQVNGASRGMQRLNFGRRGEMCADESFFTLAGIQLTSSLPRDSAQADACPALTDVWPTATISLLPATQEVKIVVPPEALEKENSQKNYQQGGTAGLLNYSAYHSHFTSDFSRSDFSYLNLETGLNVGDWMVRGTHNLRQSSVGGFTFDNAYIYAQKTLVNRKQLLQAGQINFSNNLLTGAAIDGMQLVPQTALNQLGSGVQVNGMARADQSRVDIRQNGILIYSTLVPVGPFTLTDIPVLNTTGDLHLKVITPSGQEEAYTVTAASFRSLVPKAPESWSLALGRLRADDVSQDYQRPWVASLSDGWGLSRQVLLEAGAITASDYLAGGAGLTVSPHQKISMGLSIALSQDRNHDRRGAKSTASVNWQAPMNIGFGGDITRYSPGYRELTDSVSITDSPYNRTSAGLRMSWHQRMLGNVSISASQIRQGNNSGDTRRLMATWNRNFGFMNASVNWQRQSRHLRDCRESYRCHDTDRDSVFVNFSFPLGGQQVSSYYRHSSDSSVAGMQASGSMTQNSNWSLAAEHNLKQERNNSLSGNLTGNLHYTTAGLYGYVEDNNVRNYSGTLSGGVVLHQQGIVFSPHKIHDTFGVVAVEPAVSGVEINTPQGTVWTDWRGKAVVPGLPAYAPGKIELNTEQLPENIDVNNGYRQVVAGHGAVTDTRFLLQQTRNGLLTVTMADGKPLPKGSAITTEDGSYVTTAVDFGTVFLTDLNDQRPLMVRWQEQSCSLHYSVPEKAGKGEAYESITATCS
ncbi:fimbrial biogenesis usher protein [Pragia fontium]|uniref:fimbrial biogenesis usher protein n=1 Tax=Pragia fontium TaxID=82985 RepID=UPI0011C02D7A|nr:fimbrial biogenesis usher protein [Pragia fontium]